MAAAFSRFVILVLEWYATHPAKPDPTYVAASNDAPRNPGKKTPESEKIKLNETHPRTHHRRAMRGTIGRA